MENANFEKIAEVLRSKGWEISGECLGNIFAVRNFDDHGLIITETLFINEKMRWDDNEPAKFCIRYNSNYRWKHSENFFNERSRTIQRSGDLNKTIARIRNFVSAA
jgi:hypothetical protein